MDMQKATLEHFYAFVEKEAINQPSRPITHKLWCDCAVGDFAREVLGYEDEPFNFDDLAMTLFGDDANLYEYMCNDTCFNLPKTYGGMDQALNYFITHGEMDDAFICEDSH